MLILMTKYKISLHIESLVDTEMRFITVKNIKVSPRVTLSDCVFINQTPYLNPKLCLNGIKPHHLSVLFDTYRNEELKVKKQNKNCNKYGLVPSYANSKNGLLLGDAATDSFNFIVIEDSSIISLYKVIGLTNVPLRNY